MIKSINREVANAEELIFYVEELEQREELLCFVAACAGAAEPCILQACALACFGVSACFIGLHTL